jgi:hypothetical protein
MTPAARQPASPAQTGNPVSNNWQVAMAGTTQVVIHSASIKQSGIDKHKSGRRATLFDVVRRPFGHKKTRSRGLLRFFGALVALKNLNMAPEVGLEPTTP